ncbi:uncharacterized protein ARMOST_19063 [Armillaria ostoyae]|uniref:Uncharacterized protein n=1 Tax=Armillaria ostoyae TaxID=47428 RepID=A0A284S3G7_ARMOS|nr:uncharacterized protein ARMOST_19063 [Armillaria ostoyae]
MPTTWRSLLDASRKTSHPSNFSDMCPTAFNKGA